MCIRLFFFKKINIQKASASQRKMSKWSYEILGEKKWQILKKCKSLSLETLYCCLKGNSLLSPQYIVVSDSDACGWKCILLWSHADLNLNSLPCGNCVMLGELNFPEPYFFICTMGL